jgi:hypothetical protein
MSNTNLQFENAAQLFLNKYPELVAKYFSSTLLKTLVDAMQSSLPTVTAAKITFDRLVANGLPRTDGKNDEDDLAASPAPPTLSATRAQNAASGKAPLKNSVLGKTSKGTGIGPSPLRASTTVPCYR